MVCPVVHPKSSCDVHLLRSLCLSTKLDKVTQSYQVQHSTMSDSYLGCFDYKKYGDPHRMFVQGMMTRGILEPDEFEHLFDLCLRNYKGMDKVK